MAPQQTIVGDPLTPSLLRELGALTVFPATPDDFTPEGNWTNAYRIWTCHGYRESGNDLEGLLRVQRRAGRSAGPFALEVHQEILNDGGALNIVDASIACSDDELASPVRWELSSHFIGLDEKPIEDLAVKETVEVKGRSLQVTAQGKTFKRPTSRRLTADWCLFEVVQRLPFEEGTSLTFDLLEGLSLLREDHRLSYRGRYPMTTADGDVTLRGFHQLGHGVLPCEYWLDYRHRLVIAVTGNRAYILDESAEDAFRDRTEGSRRYQRQRPQQGGSA
jgi:hypothetical protein